MKTKTYDATLKVMLVILLGWPLIGCAAPGEIRANARTSNFTDAYAAYNNCLAENPQLASSCDAERRAHQAFVGRERP
jgi:hypothetical protein